MSDSATIPAAQSVAEFKIKVNGTELPPTVMVIAVHVSKIVNRVSMAKFILQDGDNASEDFPLSNEETFVPGNEVEITAGTVSQQDVIFKGIIIKHSITIRSNRAAQLVIECRHIAVKATVSRTSTALHDITDSDAMTQVLQLAGLSGGDLDIESTDATHKEMVQYNCTPWDFTVNRAEIAGKMVFTNDEKITVKTPDFSATPALTLSHGNTIIELDAEIDSRTQYKAVKSKAWDMAGQTVAESEGAEPTLPSLGDLDAATLADVIGQDDFSLLHSGAVTTDELKLWADAKMLKSRLARVRGRARFDGVATLNPGDMVELLGIGNRFNGNAFVSGVRQDYDAVSGWKTQAQFGYDPKWFIEEVDVCAPKAGGLLPGAIGLHTGVVTDNEDPDGEFRVKVKLPYVSADDDGVWARIAQADAGNERGLFFRPEVNDEVLVGFLYDDPRQPVILGMLHSSALPTPLPPSNDNHKKGYTSREKMLFLFDDEKKEITIETPGGNKVTISDDKKGITMEDQNGNKIEMNDSGIKISSQTAIEIKATSDLKLQGANLTLAGDSSLAMSGSGSSKLESSGMLELKGSMVKIN